MRAVVLASIGLFLSSSVALAQQPRNIVTVTTLPQPEYIETPPPELPPAYQRATPAETAIAAPFEEARLADENDPLLEPYPNRKKGWFGQVDLLAVFPNVRGTRVPPAGFNPMFPGRFPGVNEAGLGSSSGFHVVLGYRLDDGAGEFTIGYRSMSGDNQVDRYSLYSWSNSALAGSLGLGNTPNGVQTTLDPFGSAVVTTRYAMNVIDLAYGNHEFGLGQGWDMRWQFGPRLGTFYMEDRSEGIGILQKAVNSYIGAGPAVGLGLSRRLDRLSQWTEVSAYGGIDGAVLIGQARQTFQESIATYPVSGEQYSSKTQTQAVEMLGLELGLRSQSIHHPNSFFSLGYRYDQWWSVGNVGSSRVDWRGHSIVARWQRNF